MILTKKQKIILIKKAFGRGKIKKLDNGCYSVPPEFFILDITPELIKEVLK